MLSPFGSTGRIVLHSFVSDWERAWLRCVPWVAAVMLSQGCAHGQSAEAGAKDSNETRQIETLRQRVLALEAHVSDMEAQLDLVAQRNTGTTDGRRAEVSLGASPPAYQPPPAYRPSTPVPSERQSAQRVYVGIGRHSIDLEPPASPDDEQTAYLEPANSSPPSQSEFSASGQRPAVTNAAGGGNQVSFDALPAERPGAMVLPAQSSSQPSSQPSQQDNAIRSPSGTVEFVYGWAREQMKQKKFAAAIAGFEDILSRHLENRLADNALYWTGVCHLEMGDARMAISVWGDLPLRFPGSPKMPDSLYGMASAHEALGEASLAETLYAQLVQQYPHAERVNDAKDALERLAN